MSRNESQTCHELIEPALKSVGWSWDAQLVIGPGKVNITQGSMYDADQRIVADYLLRFYQMPLAILEAKKESEDAEDGIQQGSRYAERLGLRFVVSSNGHNYILLDRETGEIENFNQPPSPFEILERLGRRVDWEHWKAAFEATWYVDQIAQKKVRPFQQMAIYETLSRFAEGQKRVLLLMATGTGKTFTVFQLVWKLVRGGALKNNRVLFLTDRNSLQDQAYRAFSAFPQDDRVVITKDAVRRSEHTIGKMFFANYQTLCEEFNGREIYKQYDPAFFDLIIIDECHRSGFGDWFGVLEHFLSAYQLGLTATPRELEQSGRPLSPEELRRDTYTYFTGSTDGKPAYTYSLKQAIEDGYLVPYLLEERNTNLDEFGFTHENGRIYNTQNFEREIRLPERTRAIAEDLWQQLNKHELEDEKTIIFCVDDTHAAIMAQEFRRLSGDENYAARITRSERNSHQLERNFSEIGRNKPRIAVTVDLLTTGFDAPDVKNIVFARPVRSAILYKQMKGRGTRLCGDIDKRYFTIWDYAGASILEDTEFDGHPANVQKGALPAKKPSLKRIDEPVGKPVVEGVEVFITSNERYVCLADGQKIQFDEYCEKSKEVVRSISTANIEQLLRLWIDKKTRQEMRDELKDRDIYVQALRHYFELDDADDVDILAKVGFDLADVPMRGDRKARLVDVPMRFDEKQNLFVPDRDSVLNEIILDADKTKNELRRQFWRTSLDHYALYGIDDLERGETYNAPQFANQFGNFTHLLETYGGAGKLKDDLEAVKRHLYVSM